jgi:hypothetical protein
VTARVASLLLIALALPLATASAQERTATPSAKELWQSYPLQTSPTPQAPPAQPARSTPARSTPARSTPARSTPTQSGAPLVPLLLLGVGLGLAAAALPELRRRRRPAAEPEPEPEPARTRATIAPPNPHRAWTAEIEWHETCFRVTTRPPGEHGAVLAESGPLAWPPADPAAVQALSEAAQRLEAALISAGWQPLPAGREWYAKRFAWEPADARRPPARPRGRAPAHAR